LLIFAFHLLKKARHLWLMPIIQATSGFRGQEDRASMGKSFSRLYLENTQKGLVKRLKVYVLSSNSSTTKQKKEKKLQHFEWAY
jgi:hypothetical protein